jgi:hypothetical protein
MSKIKHFFFLLALIMYSMNAMEKANSAKAVLEEYLTQELKDPMASRELADVLVHDILTHKIPTIPITSINSIVAYAFGNRILPNGDKQPGPVNEILAKIVEQLYAQTKAPVYAQWEIAEAITTIPKEHITVIHLTIEPQGNAAYLSTEGVALTITDHAFRHDKILGKVGVIAFQDHLHRCIQISRNIGIDAWAPEGYRMPYEYDAESGQSWTRNRHLYLLTDCNARIMNYLQRKIVALKK